MTWKSGTTSTIGGSTIRAMRKLRSQGPGLQRISAIGYAASAAITVESSTDAAVNTNELKSHR